MSIEKDSLGNAIQQVRLARGMTQAELAKAAGLSSVALIEQGKRSVSVGSLNALANALDIPPACLAILGSRNIGKNKAATYFMRNLQNLISTVVSAQAELRIEEMGERTKRDLVNEEWKSLSDRASQLGKRRWLVVGRKKKSPKHSRKAQHA